MMVLPVTGLSWTILPSLGGVGRGQFTAVRAKKQTGINSENFESYPAPALTWHFVRNTQPKLMQSNAKVLEPILCREGYNVQFLFQLFQRGVGSTV